MKGFNNPTPITLDFSAEEVEVQDGQLDLAFEPEVELEEPEEVEEVITEEPITPTTPKEEEKVVDLSFEEEKEKQPEGYEDNPYLKVINTFFDKGIFDPENVYEGFSDDTEPSEEVLEKFIEHNFQLRDQKTLEEFVETISPKVQRILQFDLNSKGEEIDSFLRVLIEEDSIKSLDFTNEYDQEKIVRMWYKESFSNQEIDEKIEDLKTAGLLEKEATKLKPKLDAKAEEIAKNKEEGQKYLAQMENQRKQIFYQKVEDEIKKGNIDGIPVSKEDAERMINLLYAEDVVVRLPEGREIRMNGLEAEIFRHKYSNKGDIKLLLKAAYQLVNPEKFYNHFATSVKNKVTNEFVKNQKYNITKSTPTLPEKKEKVGWNRPK